MVKYFSQLLFFGTSILLFSGVSFAEVDEYEIHLNPNEVDYELTGKLFSEEIKNAYPGMRFPVRKIYITNNHSEAISMSLNMDIIEPNLDWIEGQIYFEQAGNRESILLDAHEHNFENKEIRLYPKEKVYLEVHYFLNGGNITNKHQNQQFFAKWKLICEIQKESDNQLPSTNEKARSYHLWGILIVFSAFVYICNKRIYAIKGGNYK